MQNEYRLDHKIILKSVKNILRIVSENKPGSPNPEAKKNIFALTEPMRKATTDPYIGEKTVWIKHWADVIYSARKHRKYHGGANSVVSFLIGECLAAEVHIKYVKKMQSDLWDSDSIAERVLHRAQKIIIVAAAKE